ncbi:hypothetical protein ElyMa_003239800 [Elysia marginata]|uniref:Reverse transcriptase domain-containing protein n=1 Tax=Elysia marginata TaxID=1093978 RepID=A0AAV4J549_9GAST|nr:hypothetical protein ElyMa_003239800 [Elysia marginata]
MTVPTAGSLTRVSYQKVFAKDAFYHHSSLFWLCGIYWDLWQQLDDLDFASDLAFLSHTKGQMQSKTEDLNIISKSLGLRTHGGKSKVLRSGVETEEAIIYGTGALEEVVSFT